jgi:hypothetical protein
MIRALSTFDLFCFGPAKRALRRVPFVSTKVFVPQPILVEKDHDRTPACRMELRMRWAETVQGLRMSWVTSESVCLSERR